MLMIKVLFPWLRLWNSKKIGKFLTKLFLFISWATLHASWVAGSWDSPDVTTTGLVAICGAYMLVAIVIPMWLWFYGKDFVRWMEGC